MRWGGTIALFLTLVELPLRSVAAPAQIRVGLEPGRTRIVVDLQAPVIYRQVSQRGERGIVFELDDVTLDAPVSRAEFRGTPVTALRVSASTVNPMRLQIDTDREGIRVEHFTLRPHAGRGDRLVIDLYESEPETLGAQGAMALEVPQPAVVKPAQRAKTMAEMEETELIVGTDFKQSDWDETADSEHLSDIGSSLRAGGLRFRPRGYAELSSAYTWPGENRWSKLRARIEYGTDGKFGDDVRFRIVARAEGDAAYVVEDDFYPEPVRDDQRSEFTLREAYVDFDAADWDFRVGRQHVVWGEMVGLFLADVVSAKDTREFYLQEFEAIRLPQWAVRAEHFGTNGHLELLWVPWVTYDNVGKPGANFYPFPGLSGSVPDITPDRDVFANLGYGMRYSTLMNGWDMSGFYYQSTDVAPTLYRTASGPELRHDRIRQVGATFSKDLRGLVLKGEAVYTAGRSYISDGPRAEDGVEQSDVVDYIVGVTIPRDDWNFDFQLYGSHRFGHTNGMLADANEFGATALAGYQFNERVEAQILYLTGFNRSDESIQAWFGWRFSPSWRFRAGVDWFDGEEIGFFGRYDEQDRVYLELKRWF